MVYEWGKLPSKGYPEETPEDTEIHKGDLVIHELQRTYPPREEASIPISESKLATEVRNKINQTQRCTYVRVEAHPVQVWNGFVWLTSWVYTIKIMTYIKQASPLTGVEITVIIVAVCALLGVTIVYLHPIFYKWAGLSPEEIQAYLGATTFGITLPIIIIAGLVVLALFIFFVWRKR